MPILYEYLGIIIKFYSNEHEPIHVHAIYDNSEIKVSFFLNEGIIFETTYTAVYGKFPKAKIKVLKNFISKYETDIVYAWTNYFILKKSIKKQIITKKL